MELKSVMCKNCEKDLGDFSIKTFMNVFKGYSKNGHRVPFCDEKCYEQYKKNFEIEIYNERPIYMIQVNGEKRYMPYWFSHYYFTDIDDCKRRMDSSRISIPY